MKKRMEELLTGKFEYNVPKLKLSSEEIDVTVQDGEDYQGDFFFGTKDNSLVKGMLFSDNRRIVLSRDSFSGNSISVFYRLDTSGLVVGEGIEGTITICSSLGEYKIPVKLVVSQQIIETSKGQLDNLEQFAKLAQENPQEAFRLYGKESFKQLLKNENLRYEELYKGLSKNPITYQHMEEFLIATGQKEVVEISVPQTKIELLNLEGSKKISLPLTKNTWGNIRLDISAEGSFLAVEKRVVTADDFVGSVYELEYVILCEHLKNGKYHGKIVVKSVYETLVIEIVASARREYEIKNNRFEKQTLAEMSRDYLALLTKRRAYRAWQEQTKAHIDELYAAGTFDLRAKLYETYLYYDADNAPKTLEAMNALSERSFTRDDYEEEGLYLYLCKQTDLFPNEKLDVSSRIETLYRKHQDSFMLLWLLLKVNDEFINSPAKQMYMLERQYELGCNSPFLYMEAAKLIVANDDMLKKLSPFMINTLNFARRYEMMTEGVVMKTAYLANHEKRFNELVYNVLAKAYEEHPSKDLLESICRFVILGNPRQNKYFKWYQEAVNEDIRITKLYEFYVEAMDGKDNVPLPQEVKLYFAYNNTLGNNRKAFVYARIIKEKDSDPKMYDKYSKIIKEFAYKSLKEQKINEDYAVVYQDVLSVIEDHEEAVEAAKIAFTHRLFLDDPKIRNVIVCHAPLLKERVYPCVDGVAFIDVYTKDAQILFEDAHHQRFATTINYNQQKLFDNQQIVEQCIWQDVKDEGLLLHMCGSDLDKTNINVRNLGCFQHVAMSEDFTKEYVQKARRKLLSYYDSHAEDSTVNEYLGKIDYQDFFRADPVLLVDILVKRHFIQEAFTLICNMGYEKVPVTTLFKLCRTTILETEFIENEELIDLAYFCLIHDKYDAVILSYLQDNYIGPVSAMINITEKLSGFDLDTYAMEEEILLLAMYSRVYDEKLSKVFEDYLHHRGKDEVIRAFLCFVSYGYFIGDIRIDQFMYAKLEELFEQEQDVDIITALALLKRYRYRYKLTEKQRQNIVAILEKCHKRNLRFAMFAKLPRECTKAFQIDDKMFVEEIIYPGAEVNLYYSLTREDEEPKYARKLLTDNYHGIFTREFLLFYGEQLTWYMKAEDGDDLLVTEPKVIKARDNITEEGSKYQLINQMLADSHLKKDEALTQTMEKYLRQEHFINEVFKLED